MFQTPVLTGAAKTSYTALHINNPLAYGWNPLQSIPTTFPLIAGGKPTFTYGNMGESPSNPQPGTFNAPVRPKLPFLATLNFPDFSKIMNDPMRHNSSWPPVPTKLPSDISKFKGKVGDDPGAHVTTFHLWCSSNSLNDHTVWLRLFQRTLTNTTTKWYIELPSAAFDSF